MLKFDAYFQEAVHERREERYRIRKCVIYFYLEDDTIQVLEPKQENSGIPQGTKITCETCFVINNVQELLLEDTVFLYRLLMMTSSIL